MKRIRDYVMSWVESRRLWRNREWREQIAESEALWKIELESMSNMEADEVVEGSNWITWDNRSPLFDPTSAEYIFPAPPDPWAGPWLGDGRDA